MNVYLNSIDVKTYMKPIFILSVLFACVNVCFAQGTYISVSGDYEELADPEPHDDKYAWADMKAPVMLGWGSIDVRYGKHDVPRTETATRLSLTAWRGERLFAQAVLWTGRDIDGVMVDVGDLRQGSYAIPASAVTAGFVRYVMTDGPNDDGSGCGYRDDKSEWDSSLVADVLDIALTRDVEACSTQPIWVKVRVPSDARAGRYRGTVTVSGTGMKPMRLQLEINVLDRTLPEPQEWALHLDMWQNPYAVARYYGVPLWSREHLDLMLPVMKMLADVGQRSVTASIVHKPWNGQTEDHFDSMITRIRRIDGTWCYDYTVFDKWVTFMTEEVGIDGMISCYTMIPWALRFDYYDQATSRVQFVEARPGEEAYAEYWVPFLKDFARHLREKGWFDKTTIAMDERPMSAMREAIKVIREADPGFKISLAGNYHPEIVDDLYYLSIPYGHAFPPEVKARRERNGQISCVYTCCTEAFPNIFTFSDPAEAAWTAVHSLAGGYDGYLRWSVNAWTADPLRDSRFRLFAAGDTYSIYPGPRSSIRFERLTQGLQYCEKIRILREELKAEGLLDELDELNETIVEFTPEGFAKAGKSAARMVGELGVLLNSY